jgi:hypothetical protein
MAKNMADVKEPWDELVATGEAEAALKGLSHRLRRMT